MADEEQITQCPTCADAMAMVGDIGNGDDQHQCIYRTKLRVIAKRFRLLQQTLEQQQLVLEKQQRKLDRQREKLKLTSVKSKSKTEDIKKIKYGAKELNDPSLTLSKQDKIGDMMTNCSNKTPNLDFSFIPAKGFSSDSKEISQIPTKKSQNIADAPLRTVISQKVIEPPIVQNDTHATHKRLRYTNTYNKVSDERKDQAFPMRITAINPNAIPTSKAQPNTTAIPYKYIEVVRKRDERAKLPGHACDECKRYYAALGEEFQGQQDMCSRHRATWEPYSTPEDFWRLSFPESQKEQ